MRVCALSYHRYRYNASGQRIWRQTGVPGESFFDAEHHVRDAARLIGAFDNGGALRHWNIHAGGLNPMGRIDYWIDEGTYDQLVIDDDSLEARLRDEVYVMTRQSALEALGDGSANAPAAILVTAVAMPAAEDSLVVYIDAALAAAESVGLTTGLAQEFLSQARWN